MQAFRSSSGSSGMQPKPSPAINPRSLSPKIRRASSFSSGSVDSKPSKVPVRKPSPMSQSFQEKQRTRPVSEMPQEWGQLQDELKRVKEERSHALEELAELKKRNEKSTQNNDRIAMLEVEVVKAKESEMKMLESLFSQTKQLEETKMLLEEANLEVRNLVESEGNGSSSLGRHHLEKNGSLESLPALEEIRKLRNELSLALEAEEKSKKAMDDFAIALHEVTTEANQANSELAVAKYKLDKARAEAEETNSLLHSTEQKLQEVLNEYDKLKLDHEEFATAWKAKEESFMNWIKISEEDMNKLDQENSGLADANRVTREDNSKLRDIMKQAVSEATGAKESLEIARNENYELKKQLFSKDAALQQIRQDYESLKVSEAAALDSVSELKNLLASVSSANSKKPSSSADVQSLAQSAETIDDRKISKSTRKFPSDRWKVENPPVQNGHRHSVAGESDIYYKSLAFDKGGVLDNKDAMLRSSLFSEGEGININGVEHLDGKRLQDKDNEKPKKKKTVLGRFGDSLRRRSFFKP